MLINSHLLHHIHQLLEKAIKLKGITGKPLVIVGLSGGPDSVFLLYLMHELYQQGSIKLMAAHLDHQWRTESPQDVQLCQELCDNLAIPLVTGQASTLPITIKYNGSKEEVGRTLRRFFFKQTREQYGADFVALAHHQQDQQETFFMRLLRGSTLSGLHCMRDIDDIYLRPLLHTSKEDIVASLNTNAVSYVHDATNASDAFLRNRIRNHVLPALAQCDQRFNQKFESTLQHLQEEDDFLAQLAQDIFNGIFVYDQELGHYRGTLTAFNNASIPAVVQKRIIIHWLIVEKAPFAISTNFIEEILRFLHSTEGGTHAIRHNLTIHKKQGLCWLSVVG